MVKDSNYFDYMVGKVYFIFKRQAPYALRITHATFRSRIEVLFVELMDTYRSHFPLAIMESSRKQSPTWTDNSFRTEKATPFLPCGITLRHNPDVMQGYASFLNI